MRFRPLRLARQPRLWLPALAVLALLCAPMSAQDTGQICLRAFDDLNQDGVQDPDEGPLVRGIAASLLNARGVTISSALLQDSPFAADGLLCFDQLLAGDYRVIISSSEYRATSASIADAAVQPGAAPPRIDFGAKSLAVQQAPSMVSGLAALDELAAQSLVAAAFAAAAVITVMIVLGALAYVFVFRRRLRKARAARRASAASASRPPPRAEDDWMAPPLTKDPSAGSPPLFTDLDQEW